MSRPKPRLVFVVTVPVTASVLLRGQLSYLRDAGFDVTVISAPGPELDIVAEREGVRVIAVPMAREIRPRADLEAVGRLTAELKRLRPDIVNASTAKAGLLGMMASAALRVPVRVYLLRGLRLETERGAKRATLAGTERVAAACAHRIVCVSESLRDTYVRSGYAPAWKCRVLRSGSSNGVDAQRFDRTEELMRRADALRGELHIDRKATVIGFVGRPVRDKGMVELLDAFESVSPSFPDTKLLLVGAGFAGDEAEPAIAERLRAHPQIVAVGRVDDPAPYYGLMDILAFPSYREGFPNVPLEAASCGVPTVGFRATGVRDAVRHELTGLLSEVGDTEGLTRSLERYLRDPILRRRHGRSACERARAEFTNEIVWDAWRTEYEQLLRARELSTPITPSFA